jgi:hypothetical protein
MKKKTPRPERPATSAPAPFTAAPAQSSAEHTSDTADDGTRDPTADAGYTGIDGLFEPDPNDEDPAGSDLGADVPGHGADRGSPDDGIGNDVQADDPRDAPLAATRDVQVDERRDDTHQGASGYGLGGPAPRQWSRGPVPVRDIALVVGLLVVVAFTAVLVRSALRGPPETTVAAQAQETRSDVPRPPAEAPRAGTYVESRITADGDIRVRQWVRSPTPLFQVRLEMPSIVGGRRVAPPTDVFVTGDQAILNQPGTVGPEGRRMFFNAPPRVVFVSYTLEDAVDRSPSAPGRVLARATALQVIHGPQVGPSRITLLGKKVLSMACASTPGAELRPCGEPGPGTGRWSVLLKGAERNATVVAQVDLG